MTAMMISDEMNTGANLLLRDLAPEAIARLKPEYVHVSLGDELIAPYVPVRHLNCPTTAVIAMAGEMSNGRRIGPHFLPG